MRIWATGGQIDADLGNRRSHWCRSGQQEVALEQIWAIGGHKVLLWASGGCIGADLVTGGQIVADLGSRRPHWRRSADRWLDWCCSG